MNVDSWSPKILSLMRFVVGLVFLQHGTQKILHFPAALAPPRPWPLRSAGPWPPSPAGWS